MTAIKWEIHSDGELFTYINTLTRECEIILITPIKYGRHPGTREFILEEAMIIFNS